MPSWWLCAGYSGACWTRSWRVQLSGTGLNSSPTTAQRNCRDQIPHIRCTGFIGLFVRGWSSYLSAYRDTSKLITEAWYSSREYSHLQLKSQYLWKFEKHLCLYFKKYLQGIQKSQCWPLPFWVKWLLHTDGKYFYYTENMLSSVVKKLRNQWVSIFHFLIVVGIC